MNHNPEFWRNWFEDSPIPMACSDWSEVKRIVDQLLNSGITSISEYIGCHPEILAELVPAARIVHANSAALRLYKATNEQELIEAFKTPPDIESYNSTNGLSNIVTPIERLSTQETCVELEGPEKALDGSLIYVRATTTISRGYKNEWGRVLQTIEDITEKDRVQKALEENLALLNQSADLVNLGYAVWHEIDDKYIAVSENYAKLFGYEKEKFLKTFTTLEKDFELVHPEDRDRYRTYLYEGEDFEDIEYRIVRLDGEIRHVLQRYEYVFDASGQPTQSLVSIQDITERKLMEEELRRSNEELQAFSYSVSHDLRAPLRVMNGFNHIIQEDYGSLLDETGRNYLERIDHSTAQMGQIIDGLLNLARLSQRKMRFDTVALDTLATDIMSELRASGPDREVEMRVHPGLQVDGDPALLQIALANLLSNAWKFTSREAHAVIEFGVLDGCEPRTFFVRDNGVGFDSKYADSIFRAFQRLHDTAEFEGVGIGLHTAQRIVERHGGRLWVDAIPERGATFFFTLAS
jgi:PAS domain S-box-containing protein